MDHCVEKRMNTHPLPHATGVAVAPSGEMVTNHQDHGVEVVAALGNGRVKNLYRRHLNHQREVDVEVLLDVEMVMS